MADSTWIYLECHLVTLGRFEIKVAEEEAGKREKHVLVNTQGKCENPSVWGQVWGYLGDSKMS